MTQRCHRLPCLPHPFCHRVSGSSSYSEHKQVCCWQQSRRGASSGLAHPCRHHAPELMSRRWWAGHTGRGTGQGGLSRLEPCQCQAPRARDDLPTAHSHLRVTRRDHTCGGMDGAMCPGSEGQPGVRAGGWEPGSHVGSELPPCPGQTRPPGSRILTSCLQATPRRHPCQTHLPSRLSLALPPPGPAPLCSSSARCPHARPPSPARTSLPRPRS